MCYGANCRWEGSWSGECSKPRGLPCPLEDEDENEFSEDEIAEILYGREDFECQRYVERREEGLSCLSGLEHS